MWTFEIILALLAVGSAAGLIAGLFGLGGGTLIVPLMLWILQLQGLANHEYAQHMAIGTSFAVMVFTAFSSVIAQHRKQSIDWPTVFRMAPGMILGVFIGSATAKYIPTVPLQIFFIVFIAACAIKTLTGANPKASRQLPRTPALASVGGLFGAASSWVGIGGGALTVPFLVYCNMPHLRAVGTSSGLAWPIAVTGTISYIFTGLNVANLPSGTFGFIYLPAVAILSVATIIFAPIGVRTAHKLPKHIQQRAFGLLLLLIAIRMAWQVWH